MSGDMQLTFLEPKTVTVRALFCMMEGRIELWYMPGMYIVYRHALLVKGLTTYWYNSSMVLQVRNTSIV